MSELRKGSFRRLLRNLRRADEHDRIDNALAYCDRILATNPNGAELMFLGRVKAILTGTDDGTTVREGSDG